MNRVRSKLRLNYMRAWMRKRMGWIPCPARCAIVGVIGGTLMLLALIGFILPVMPGFIFVPFGLAILAVEFAWAARWLKKIKRGTKNARQRMRSGRNVPTGLPNKADVGPSCAARIPPPRNATMT